MRAVKNTKLIIIHFQPLELYPPVINLLQFANDNVTDTEITILTNQTVGSTMPAAFTSANIRIKRIVNVSKHHNIFLRIFGYFCFNLYSLFFILIKKPSVIMYYETISAWPAIVYKMMYRQNIFLFAHYHEYTTPKEYLSGMKLTRINHRMEKKYYSSYTWISHTNEVRMEKFRFDNNLRNETSIKFGILPNYPTKKWEIKSKVQLVKPYKLVMLGAIGYDTMYLKEIVDWAYVNKDVFSLDFFSNNSDTKAVEYLKKFQNTNISLKAALNYSDIPDIIKKYDVGLVIYKPFSENTIHAVSNKVFEYSILGLDVWFPYEMQGTIPYIKTDSYPKIIPLNFSHLNTREMINLLNRKSLRYRAPEFYYEKVYPCIFDKINELVK